MLAADASDAGDGREVPDQQAGELAQGGLEQGDRRGAQAERGLLQIATHGGRQLRRSGCDLFPVDLADWAVRPRPALSRLAGLAAVEHHRIQPEQRGGQRPARCPTRAGPGGHHRLDEPGPGLGVDLRGQLARGSAGDQTDPGQVHPHPSGLLLAEPQLGALGTELLVLVGTGGGQVMAPSAAGSHDELGIDHTSGAHHGMGGERGHLGAHVASRLHRRARPPGQVTEPGPGKRARRAGGPCGQHR